jgi:hypothetical protein
MSTMREIVEIHASPDQVFPYLIEPENLLRVMEGLRGVNETASAPPDEGRHLTLVFNVLGRRHEVEYNTTRIEPGRLLAGRTRVPGLEILGVQELEAIDGGTRLTTTCSNNYDSLYLRLLSRLTERQGRRKLRQTLLNTKRVIEADLAAG